MIGVKVRLHDAVFYGFPYKLRPKPKIAVVTVANPQSLCQNRKYLRWDRAMGRYLVTAIVTLLILLSGLYTTAVAGE